MCPPMQRKWQSHIYRLQILQHGLRSLYDILTSIIANKSKTCLKHEKHVSLKDTIPQKWKTQEKAYERLTLL